LISKGLKPELIELETFELGIRSRNFIHLKRHEKLDILLGKLSKYKTKQFAPLKSRPRAPKGKANVLPASIFRGL